MKRRRSAIMVSVLGTAGLALYLPIACVRGAQPSSSPAAARDSKESPASSVTWKEVLSQEPAWYASAEAVRIADNVLLYQRDNGGWNKNLDMAQPLSDTEKAKLRNEKKEPESTIDNGATTQQMYYLARVYTAAKQERFRDAFLKGVDYLLAAQYPNGGWPQYYPLRKGYYTHITYNDNAMIGVMNVLSDVAGKKPDYAFVDEERRQRAEKAVAKGLDCILKTQVVVNNKRTAWGQQHDVKTLAPTSARAYEHPSLASMETLGIVRFLMQVDNPGPQVIQAVQAAIAWFEEAKQTGIRVEEGQDDRVVVAAPSAPPIWARFYEIGTNRPIFSGRDGVIKYSLAEIERERRTGYRWYSVSPAALLEAYPAWQKKWAPNQNVLQKSADQG